MNINKLNTEQRNFLNLAEKNGVNTDLFGSFVPEITVPGSNDRTKPTIAYIHTGGTLAMTKSKKNEGSISFDNAVDIEETLDICNYLHQTGEQFNTIGINLANIDSKEVTPQVWAALSATIKTIYDRVDGIIVGHGTHTLEHSAAALSFSLRDLAIPVVMTASQIPIIGHPGSDGIGNLTGAMKIAAEANVAEVLAYANGTIHRGSRVTKENDSRFNIFESKVTGPIGYFGAAGIELKPGIRKRGDKRKYQLDFQPKFNSSVPVMVINPSTNSKVVEDVIEKMENSVGIILETYGSGALPNKLIPILKEKIQAGIPIFLTSRAGQSGVTQGMQNHDDDAITASNAGIVNARDMTTSAATVKLMNVTAQEELPMDNASKIQYVNQEMIETNYAGELTLEKKKSDF